MSVFICYSHEDEDFVDTLARVLVKNKTHVWLDRWELNVGDSLVEKIQDAITVADALLVVLSSASIKSEWCKKELSTAIMRELQEKRVLVLPVLIDDCNIPMLLSDKIYADFRTNFGEGIVQILESVARITSETLGRIEEGEYYTDFSIFWAEKDGLLAIDIHLVSLPSNAYPYSVLTIVNITANKSATKKLNEIAEMGLVDYGKNLVFDAFLNSDSLNNEKLSVILKDSEPLGTTLTLSDPESTDIYSLSFETRKLGENTGKDLLFHTGDVIRHILTRSRERARELSVNETIEAARILRST